VKELIISQLGSRFKNKIIKFVYYICIMRLVIDNMKSEHLRWLTEMAKT